MLGEGSSRGLAFRVLSAFLGGGEFKGKSRSSDAQALNVLALGIQTKLVQNRLNHALDIQMQWLALIGAVADDPNRPTLKRPN